MIILSQRGAEEPESLALEGLESGVVIEAGPPYGKEQGGRFRR
ncbi:MAG: hypothetical protein WCE61_23665 [Candidatus Acidiferrum sp.]